MRLLVISWETARSRAARRRWRELTESGEMTERPEPRVRYSRLHLQRGLREHMLCGLRRPNDVANLVINAMGDDLERMGKAPEVRAAFERSHSGPCIECAVLAAMDVDHVLIGTHVGNHLVPSEAACGCGWTVRGYADPLEAHRAHVELVVSDALIERTMSPAERRLFRALEAA